MRVCNESCLMWPGDWGQLQQLQENILYSFDYKNTVCLCMHSTYCMSECALHARLSVSTVCGYVCVRVCCHGGLVSAAGRDSLPVLFIGAHQTHASTWHNCFVALRAPQSCWIRQNSGLIRISSEIRSQAVSTQGFLLVKVKSSACARGSPKYCTYVQYFLMCLVTFSALDTKSQAFNSSLQ